MVQPGTHTVCAPRIGSPGSACVPDVCCAQYVTADNTCGSDADCPCDRTCITSICGTSGGFCAPSPVCIMLRDLHAFGLSGVADASEPMCIGNAGLHNQTHPSCF